MIEGYIMSIHHGGIRMYNSVDSLSDCMGHKSNGILHNYTSQAALYTAAISLFS